MHHEYIDKLSLQDSFLHRLDPRVKILVTLLFIIMVISVPRYEIFTLIPFMLIPAIFLLIADIPLRYVCRHVLYVSPFILSLAIFAPVFDRQPVGEWMGWTITGGWITCGNILFKFVLTVVMTLILVSTTRFNMLLKGLESLRIPQIMIIQLSFLYRYLFVLIEEVQRLKIARECRNFSDAHWKRRLQAVTGMIALLFIRTLERAEAVYLAMVSRGFDGHIRTLTPLKIRVQDFIFTITVFCFLVLIRLYLPE